MSIFLAYTFTKSINMNARTLRYTVNHDSLTDVLNRAGIIEGIMKLEAKRIEFTVTIADIDHFKEVNDCYGHPAGDLCLQEVSRIIPTMHDGAYLCGRWGGAEFILILPEIKECHALTFANTLRQKVEESDIIYKGIPLKITLTIGVDATNVRMSSFDRIDLADRALLQGKRDGRNQVIETKLGEE